MMYEDGIVTLLILLCKLWQHNVLISDPINKYNLSLVYIKNALKQMFDYVLCVT